MYAAQKRLRQVVKDIEKTGMEVVGIGIEDRSVKDYYPKNIVLHRVSELPRAIMGEMQRLLLN